MGLILAVCLMASWSNGGWASNPPAVASAVLTVERTAYTEADDVEYGLDLADLLALPEPETLTPMGVKTETAAEPDPVQAQPVDRGYDGRTYWLRDRYGQVWTGPVWSVVWEHVQRQNEAQALPAVQVQYAPTCQYQQGADGRVYRVCPQQ